MTCGGGNRLQIRSCLNGPGCTGPNMRVLPCGQQQCPSERHVDLAMTIVFPIRIGAPKQDLSDNLILNF